MKHFIIFSLALLLFSACTLKGASQPDTTNLETTTNDEVVVQMNNSEVSKDEMVKEMDFVMENKLMKEMGLYMYSGELSDVSGGSASGRAMAGFIDGSYNMYATFNDLPDFGENFFYEGWVVRKSPFAFISTGVLNTKDGVYSNTYMSGNDYSGYDFYVLTIEPTNDGINGKPDPAPVEHILEGVMSLISQ